ncbi:hypothetical protein ACQPUW_06475 [Clostridium sardiniense]
MNIIEMEKICNKRNCVERIIYNHLVEERNIADLLINFLNYCKVKNLDSLKNLDSNSFSIISTYAIYTEVLSKYVRRENVIYQNMKQILNMLDTSKDSIRDFINGTLEEEKLITNLNKFICFAGISDKFNEEFLKDCKDRYVTNLNYILEKSK